MSRQYRAWRDFLTRSIEDYLPSDQPYDVLKTATMVGLFTCVFVKRSLLSCISSVHASEVKCGMGGFYGNKVSPSPFGCLGRFSRFTVGGGLGRAP